MRSAANSVACVFSRAAGKLTRWAKLVLDSPVMRYLTERSGSLPLRRPIGYTNRPLRWGLQKRTTKYKANINNYGQTTQEEFRRRNLLPRSAAEHRHAETHRQHDGRRIPTPGRRAAKVPKWPPGRQALESRIFASPTTAARATRRWRSSRSKSTTATCRSAQPARWMRGFSGKKRHFPDSGRTSQPLFDYSSTVMDPSESPRRLSSQPSS
jgi:hypothetical protein